MVALNWCARKKQSLLFDLFKAFDWIESSHKTLIFSDMTLHLCATCPELPYNICTIVCFTSHARATYNKEPLKIQPCIIEAFDMQ